MSDIVHIVIGAGDRPKASLRGIETPKGTRVIASGRTTEFTTSYFAWPDLLVLHVPGRTYYSGLGQQRGYRGAEFVVYVGVQQNAALFEGRELIRWGVRS